MVRKFVEQLGHNRIIMKSDTKPAILALREALGRKTSVEIVMEESLVGSRQASGAVENAVKDAQGQLRVLKSALGSRINKRVAGELCRGR